MLTTLLVNGWSAKQPLVVDAKALYDSIRAEVPQFSGDKRTKIEVMVVKEKMQECKTLLGWVSSEAQYADGMTKPSARQLLTDRLWTHMFKLQADEDFVAAKKTQQQREANARKFALSKAASKVGGLAHVIFISHIMPVTGFSSDEVSWSDDAMRLFVTMVMSFLTGCFCVWMLLGFPKALRQEPKRVAFRLAKRNQSVQCEIEYDEMSHMSYQLHLKQEDKARLEDSFKREIETLESYAQVMKDTSETNKEDANKFLSELKTLKVRLQDVEQTLTAKIQEVIELERQISTKFKIPWIEQTKPMQTCASSMTMRSSSAERSTRSTRQIASTSSMIATYWCKHDPSLCTSAKNAKCDDKARMPRRISISTVGADRSGMMDGLE